jgi:hypothetical protein
LGRKYCTADLLFDWFGLVCFANKNKKCQLSYSKFKTSQIGGQRYRDISPFSIPCLRNLWITCSRGTIYNSRERKSCLGRVYNFKLASLTPLPGKRPATTTAKLKTRPRFYPVSSWLQSPKYFKGVLKVPYVNRPFYHSKRFM